MLFDEAVIGIKNDRLRFLTMLDHVRVIVCTAWRAVNIWQAGSIRSEFLFLDT